MTASPLALYRRLPDEARRCFRPLNLIDEGASMLPDRLRVGLGTATEMARRLRSLGTVRYPLRWLEGVPQAGGPTLRCLLGVDDASARWLARTLFETPPAVEEGGIVRALEVPAAAARLAGGVDLSFWQVSWPLSRLCRRAVRVPSWVPLSMATDRTLEEIVVGDRSGRAARKNDIRRVEKLGLGIRVSRDPGECERFRRELYEPYVRGRFGDLSVAVPPHVFRHARRHGHLLLAELDGRPVAGALLERWRGDLRILVFGAALDAPIPASAAVEACYYHAIRFAVEHRFPRLAFGTSRPLLTDGVLHYKRKWGARLDPPTTWDSWLLRYRNTGGVRAALTRAPLVVERPDGGLVGLAGADGVADLEAQVRRLDTRGLEALGCLVEPGGAVSESTAARHGTLRLVAPAEVWPPEAAA